MNRATRKFRDVAVGERFYFAPLPFSINGYGPCVKLSQRTYRDEPQQFTTTAYGGKAKPITMKVGSINANVQA